MVNTNVPYRFFLLLILLWAIASLPAAGQVLVNEWMASNTNAVADPADGNFDDWFELFNAGGAAVDLSGYTLTDDVADPAKYTLPTGTVLAAEDHLLIWADEELAQGPLHANFNLNALGETLSLYAPDGTLVDSVTFGPQLADVSEGRWKDGEPAPFYPLGAFTPAAPNVYAAPNAPPVFSNLLGQTVTEGQALTLPIQASDPDAPPQSLRYFLAAGGPPGLTIDSATGQLDWTPTEPEGPGVYTVTVFATDDHNTPATTIGMFDITVLESNVPPTIAAISTQMVDEGSTFNFTPTATDPDIPTQTLAWALGPASPTNATIDAISGLIQWTAGLPGTQTFETVVTDGVGTNRLSFEVIVKDVNSPPSLAVPAIQTLHHGETYTTTLTATDADLPAQSLSFSLLSGPTGATIDAVSGTLTWPSVVGPTNAFVLFTVQVQDDGVPPLAATNNFSVFVGDPLVTSIVTASNSTVSISWPTLPGNTYTLETTDSLLSLTNAPTWTILTQGMGTGGTAQFPAIVPPIGSRCRQFYRIRKE